VRLLALAALPLLTLPGCTTSAPNPVEATDAAPDAQSGTDTATASGAPDGNGVEADAVAADTGAPRADAIVPDAGQVSGDAELRDTAPARPDTATRETGPVRSDGAAPEAAVVRADSGAPEVPPPPPDAASPDNSAIPRDDARAAETSGTGAEASVSYCKLDGGAASLVRLTPLELKTLLDSSEDPFLINVKGASIGLIPGTDAVLANDIPGIEALVGGDHCANIILYCQSGNTSQSVGTQLIAKGYVHVRDLAGGITAWKNAGYPTE